MNTKQIGDTSEAMILAALIKRGYTVSIPFGDNDPYDLVVETDRGLHRVQVKTGWLEDDCLRFKTGSQTTTDGTRHVEGYHDEIESFAVRCKDTDSLYWVPIEAAGRKNTYLRIEPPEINHPRVSLADEFKFDAALPEPRQ
jgi:hypothetical protein